MKYLEVNIAKPMYGTYVYLWDKYIKDAKRAKLPLRITIPQGSGIYWADEWVKGSRTMEKVFLRPDEPMILIGNELEIGHTPRLKGKKKKVSDAFAKFNAMSPEEQFKFTH